MLCKLTKRLQSSVISIFIQKGGDAEGKFSVDNSGRIFTIQMLDREKKATYELKVRAIDRGGKLYIC